MPIIDSFTTKSTHNLMRSMLMCNRYIPDSFIWPMPKSALVFSCNYDTVLRHFKSVCKAFSIILTSQYECLTGMHYFVAENNGIKLYIDFYYVSKSVAMNVSYVCINQPIGAKVLKQFIINNMTTITTSE